MSTPIPKNLAASIQAKLTNKAGELRLDPNILLTSGPGMSLPQRPSQCRSLSLLVRCRRRGCSSIRVKRGGGKVGGDCACRHQPKKNMAALCLG